MVTLSFWDQRAQCFQRVDLFRPQPSWRRIEDVRHFACPTNEVELRLRALVKFPIVPDAFTSHAKELEQVAVWYLLEGSSKLLLQRLAKVGVSPACPSVGA